MKSGLRLSLTFSGPLEFFEIAKTSFSFMKILADPRFLTAQVSKYCY